MSLPFPLIRPHGCYVDCISVVIKNAGASKKAPMNSRSRTSDAGSNTLGYENFLPEASFPVIRASVKGEAVGALFFLFFSALGFFFSRLLLSWLFAILFSLCLRNT
jgi:hypothetical protein